MSFVRLPISSGIAPDMPFPCSCSRLSSASRPTRGLRPPVKLLSARSSVCRLMLSNRSSGILPDSMLSAKEKNLKFCSRPRPCDFSTPSSVGIEPVSLFVDRQSTRRDVNRLNERGISDECSLSYRSNTSRFVSSPSSIGIAPVKRGCYTVRRPVASQSCNQHRREGDTTDMSSSGALPVVDLAPFFTGDDDEAGAARATDAVREACRTKARPADGSQAPLPTGYARQPAHSPDKNEYMLVFDPKLGFNVYPAEPAGFREAAEECYAKLTELGLLVHGILNECMGLPPGFLGSYNSDRGFDFLALLRYFPATEEEKNGISAHEDGNCVTFVIQDGVGGLEVLNDGDWVPVEPVDGSIIVNIGDVIQVLSNNKLKSATHRVVRKPRVHRHSLAFFFNIHGDKWVEPLPEFTAKIGEAPRYRGFVYNEYQQLRLRNKTHPPSRPEDVVHITHYVI